MEYLPSKKFYHTDGLSNLVARHREPLEDSVIASLRTDGEIKTILCNTIRELPVTLHEIKHEALNDEFINLTKTKIQRRTNTLKTVFLCDDVLMYSKKVIIPKKLQKRILKDFHVGYPGKNKSYVY